MNSNPLIRQLRLGSSLIALAILNLAIVPASAQEIQDTWQYTLRKPPEGWQEPGFDDSAWQTDQGGFGTRETPGARVSTEWSTNQIWLRKVVNVVVMPSKPCLLLHHDESVEVYLNGVLIFSADGWTTEYELVSLDEDASRAVRAGKNTLAVHCRQSSGGQFIDVHLVDADNVPELPPAKRREHPFQSELITTWGEELTAESAWTEYPRPQMRRDQWANLNGRWDYAITDDSIHEPPSEWQGQILVPFALESKLGGVQRLLHEDQALWYRREFENSESNSARQLIHFEAVDYECEVFLNGTTIGQHRGGNTPFAMEATDAIRSGRNELVVRVEDDTEGYQLRGKQVINPRGIWYTQVSGIWQTVWLESVPETYVADLVIRTDPAAGSITVTAEINGASQSDWSYELLVKNDDEGLTQRQTSPERLQIQIENPMLWSPESPFLYDLEVIVRDESGEIVDRVATYAGIRSVGKQQDSNGHWRITLNGKEIFHWGPLDQGWWPDGLLTPPSDEAMLFDIEYLKAAGFNMIRKHIKVEPRRYYYHCDRLGMLVWQDQVSAGHNPKWTRLQPNPVDAEWPDEQHQQFLLELERMIDTLENHPSIAVWVPFNEAWGQHQTVKVGKWAQKRDPSRLVNIASGGNFWPVGDMVDHHAYPHPEFPFAPDRFADYVKVMGEFGGHGLPVPNHLWDAQRRNWGYGGLPKNKQEYRQRYQESLDRLIRLRSQGIAAGVYTQTTDVEGEINGLITYDRRVIKIPAKEIKQMHAPLLSPR